MMTATRLEGATMAVKGMRGWLGGAVCGLGLALLLVGCGGAAEVGQGISNPTATKAASTPGSTPGVFGGPLATALGGPAATAVAGVQPTVAALATNVPGVVGTAAAGAPPVVGTAAAGLPGVLGTAAAGGVPTVGGGLPGFGGVLPLRLGQFVKKDRTGSGTVEVNSLQGNGLVRLYPDFTVASGPNLVVYLTKEASPGTRAEVERGFLDLGALKSTSGLSMYDVPAGTTLGDYKGVVIYSTSEQVVYIAAPLQ